MFYKNIASLPVKYEAIVSSGLALLTLRLETEKTTWLALTKGEKI